MNKEILPEFRPFLKGENEFTDEDINNFLNESEDIAKRIESLKPRDVEDEIKLPETVAEKIGELQDKIKELKSNKKATILKIIGQTYKGVLIPLKLTIRNGECYYYRKHQTLNPNDLKKLIMENLHEVTEKLTDRNMDILEYLLERVEEKNTKDEQVKEMDFDETKFIDVTIDYRERLGIDFITVNGVRITNEGEMGFFSKDKDLETNSVGMSDRLMKFLYMRFKTQIDEMSKNFVKELNTEIDNRAEELKDIKKKGSNLLMLVEIQKGSDGINGWGG